MDHPELLEALRAELNSPEMNATLHMLGRLGALDAKLDIGWAGQDDVTAESLWYARVRPRGADPIRVDGARGPLAALNGVLRKLANGARCVHCTRIISLIPINATHLQPPDHVCANRYSDGEYRRGCAQTHPGPEQPAAASLGHLLDPLRQDLFATTDHVASADAGAHSVWVTSGVDPADGRFRLTVDYTPDSTATFTAESAMAYARQVFAAAARADHDAAVVAQLLDMNSLTIQDVAALVGVLHDDRPPLDQSALGLLTLQPGVSATTRRAFLRCGLTSQPDYEWSWTVPDAREHAMFVLETEPVAELDAAYLRLLHDKVGVEEDTARLAVNGLARYRAH